MTPERWQQVKQLFNSALERPLPERSVFLSRACAGDEALRSEVESLLSSHGKEGQFIDAPAYHAAAEVLANSKASMLASGESLGSYRLLSTLGRGGMGEVYLAEDSRLGRKVALKLLPSSFTNDADRLARFEREARAASALNHPNILTIYEVGASNGRQFIAAEFVDGETLRQRQLHSPLKPNEILDIAVQVASALSAAHQAGIVHRDIKPENIMIRRDGYVKVVDFGLAKLTETARKSADTSVSTMLQVDTDTGMVMGTTAYMSPEQARGQQLDQRTDIWSFGVVLYELLSGSTPFKGDTPSDLIVSILDREPASLVTSPVFPSELDWIVRKALRKDREERYQTARELLGDLRGLKQQLDFTVQKERSAGSSAPLHETDSVTPTAGSVTGESETATTTEIEGAATAARSVSTARPSTFRTVAVIGGIAVLIMAAIAAAYRFWPSKASPRFQTTRMTRITNSGKVIHATLTPDGKYLLYALSDANKQSIWIRQVSSANDKEIVPAEHVGIFGITVSPDGNDLYYVIKRNLDAGTLYRIPIFGGTPTKLLERIDTDISFSPDGKQFVFARMNYPEPRESSLVIANRDGTGERVLATRKPPELFVPIFFTAPSWAPDGTLVAAASAKVGAPMRVVGFSVADGTERSLSPDNWSFAGKVQWLSDMSGLVVIGGESPSNSQIWLVSYPDGSRRPITNDLNHYRAVSVSADADKLTAIQQSGLINVWVAPEGDAKRAVQLPTGNVGSYGSVGNNISWTPDNKIVVASNESGSVDLWMMDAEGKNRRQLTSKAGMNVCPVVSQDGRFIVFVSSRSGARNIWRMDIDGNNPKRLSNGTSDAQPDLSPDGKWVVYSSLNHGKPTLWKVSSDGGTPVELSSGVGVAPVISPDGKFIAYMFPESTDVFAPPNRIAVIPSNGGDPIKVFEIEAARRVAAFMQWAPDGQSLIYSVPGDVTNLWRQPLAGGKPKQITEFKDGLMTSFAWTRDGKTLVCTRGISLRDAVLITDVSQ